MIQQGGAELSTSPSTATPTPPPHSVFDKAAA